MGSSQILNLVVDNPGHCRRRWARQRMLLTAQLVTVAAERTVRVRDLCAGGARVEGQDLPAEGCDVLLKRGSAEAFGTIAWSEDGAAGIAFDEALEEPALQMLQQGPMMAAAVAQARTVRRPGFGGRLATHPRWSNGRGWISG